MIYAVPNQLYESLKTRSVHEQVQEEVRTRNIAALAERVANGELVEVKNAERHAAGERDRCYICGDEVTPFHWRERGEGKVVYFQHMNTRTCIGHPANPRAVHQPAS